MVKLIGVSLSLKERSLFICNLYQPTPYSQGDDEIIEGDEEIYLMRGILWAVLQQPIVVLPIFKNGKPHHITLFYDVDKTQYQHLIGTEFKATAIFNIWNKDIQAIAMLMPQDIPHKANPHITVSYREGIESVASNDLFKRDDDRVIAPYSQKLNFKIEFFEFTECDHQWLRNGKRKGGIQQWICKHCKKSRSGDGTVKRGRPFKKA